MRKLRSTTLKHSGKEGDVGGGGKRDPYIVDNLVLVNAMISDYQAALDCLERCHEFKKKKLGKTYPGILTLMNMAIAHENGLKDYLKVEKNYRGTLNGYKGSLDKDFRGTKSCVQSLVICSPKTI